MGRRVSLPPEKPKLRLRLFCFSPMHRIAPCCPQDSGRARERSWRGSNDRHDHPSSMRHSAGPCHFFRHARLAARGGTVDKLTRPVFPTDDGGIDMDVDGSTIRRLSMPCREAIVRSPIGRGGRHPTASAGFHGFVLSFFRSDPSSPPSPRSLHP